MIKEGFITEDQKMANQPISKISTQKKKTDINLQASTMV